MYSVTAAEWSKFGKSAPKRIGHLRNMGANPKCYYQDNDRRIVLLWCWRALQLQLASWQHISQLLQVYSCLLQQSIDVCCAVDCKQELVCRRFPSCKTIDACSCNALLNIETGIQIRNKFVLMNPALICVRCYANKHYLPQCIIKCHSRWTPKVMVWGAIAHHGQLLRIVGNQNSNK